MPTERFEVVGHVQGVGFRWFVREQARALQLSGHVRNLPGGSVEIVASGTPAALAALQQIVREGPPGARVDQVHRAAVDAAAELAQPFAIAR